MATSRAAIELHAIVLAVHNAGEAHRVVHLFDHRLGRLGVWARYARGSRRRLAGVLEPFYTLRVTAAPQSELYNLHAAEVATGRPQLRGSLSAIGRAATLCNLVRAVFLAGEPATQVYAGLEVALDHLEAGREARAAGLYPRLAVYAGIMPDLTACGRCRAALAPLVLGGGEGGGHPVALCTGCAPRGTPVAPQVVAALRGARIEDDATAEAVETIVSGWLSVHVGRPLTPWAAR